MPIPGQSALTNISTAKELSVAYQPLVVAQIVWPDGTTLRLSTENLSATTGGNQYNGFDWEPRMSTQDIGAISSLSDNGIVQSPQVQLKLADADKFLWNEFEIVKGFKGATLTLLFIFWDPDTDTFSADSRIKFIGICDPPSIDHQYLTLTAVNKINLANFFLPVAQISQRCIWTFPVDKAGRVRAATAVNSPEYRCHYSPDVSDADAPGGTAGARGNMNGGGVFTDCDFTWENCIARMGNAGLVTTTNDPAVPVQIEQDTSGRSTGTFGGIHYDPPDSWRGKAFTSGNLGDGVNQTNQAKFNDYYPQTWGVSFIEPPVMNVVGDPNSTRFEIVLCIGDIFPDHHPNLPGPIQLVIVNDFSVPFIGSSSDPLLAWSWVNFGGVFGHTNRGAIYDGQGDPYGSMAALQVVVPNIVAGSNSIPSVQVLTEGPAVRVWASTDPTDFTTMFTSNFSWCLLDVLTNCGLQVSDLNLKTFIDGAAISAVQVTYTDLLGHSEQHDRYNIGITLRERRTAADVLTNLLAAGKATLVPDDTGLLALVIKQTLADQQVATIDGSNSSLPVDSADGTGLDKNGYYAYLFDESSILRKEGDRNQPTSFSIRQRPMRDTPNKVNVPFQDEDYSYAADSLTVVDSEDVGRTGVTVNGGVKAEGVVNIDQAKRVIETQLAEQFRGNPRTGINDTNDTGGTWIAEFETSFKAIHLKVGDIIAITFTKFGLDTQPFRIIGVTAKANGERIAISAQWHEDDWYLDSYGQNPAPLLQAKHLNSLLRPPFGWLPNQEAPLNSNPLYDPTELNFAIAQMYQAANDSTIIATLKMTGHQPVNVFSSKSGPAYAPAATYEEGGNLLPGQYFFSLVAEGSDGLPCAPSRPLASATVPPTKKGTILIPNIYWMPGTIGFKLYGGTNPNKLSLQVDGSEGGTPTSITVTDYVVAGEAMPDIEFDHLLYTYKRVKHPGVWSLPIEQVDTNVLTFTGLPFTPGEYVGSVVTILGQINSSGNLPIWDFLISANDNTDDLVATFTVGSFNGHTPDLVALGVKTGDMMIMRATANIISDTTIGDTRYFNEIQFLNPILNINDAVGSPIVLGFTTPHNMTDGQDIRVYAVQGNTAANGPHTIALPTTDDDGYNATHVILTGVDSNGTYEGYGVAQSADTGLVPHAEIGNIVRIIGGTGRGQKRKIVENDTNSVTIDAKWDTLPGVDSHFIIEESGLLGSLPSSTVHNADPAAELVSSLNVDNYPGQVLLVQAYACDAEGNQSVDSDSPFREIYVFGGPGSTVTQYDKATFNIATIIDMAVDDDVAPHYIVKRAGTPVSCDVQAKIPPSGGAAILDIILKKADGSYTGSIFGSTKIVIPDGSTDLITLDKTFFASQAVFSEQDILTVNVTQIGATQAGRVVSIVVKWPIG